jgi:hypothetical protein
MEIVVAIGATSSYLAIMHLAVQGGRRYHRDARPVILVA